MSAPDFESRYRVAHGRFRLADHDPADTAGLDRARAGELLAATSERLRGLQARLYAEDRQALLVILQGLDASGKDGAVSHVFGALNPSAVRVTSFKAPTPTELAHDWLWRCAAALPPRGQIGVFNRSHYEEVIAVRVHPAQLASEVLDPAGARHERFWTQRMETITSWERHLVACGTSIVKLFLNISKEEQRERLLARANDPDKQWKLTPQDVAERAFWDASQDAYTAAIRATSTPAAPWYAIPADHKWLARAAIAQIVAHNLERMDPRYPEPDEQSRRAVAAEVAQLESEG